MHVHMQAHAHASTCDMRMSARPECSGAHVHVPRAGGGRQRTALKISGSPSALSATHLLRHIGLQPPSRQQRGALGVAAALDVEDALQPYVGQAATLRGGGCNPTWGRLQPYARRLQPYVGQAATLRGAGCSPTWGRLQPYVGQAAALCEEAPRPSTRARRRLVR
eukprot:scaffold5737_cov41-Phaeocystis_antarctica.AAC.1